MWAMRRASAVVAGKSGHLTSTSGIFWGSVFGHRANTKVRPAARTVPPHPAPFPRNAAQLERKRAANKRQRLVSRVCRLSRAPLPLPQHRIVSPSLCCSPSSKLTMLGMNIFRYARATANGRHSCTPPHSNHRTPATFLLRFAMRALFVRVLIASAALAPQVGG